MTSNKLRIKLAPVKIFWIFIKARVSSWFSPCHRPSIAYKSLFSLNTFRIKSGEEHQAFPALKYLRSVYHLLFFSDSQISKTGTNNEMCLEINVNMLNERKKYFEALTNLSPAYWWSRSQMGNSKDSFYNLLTTFFTALLFFTYLPHVIFSKKRVMYGLVLLEYAEWCILIKNISTRNIQKIYLCNPYEIDYNFISLLFKKFGVEDYKIPASNSLEYFYKDLVAFNFVTTAPFQKEEVSQMKNWFVEHISELPTQNLHHLLALKEKESGHNKEDITRNIGLLTRGMWRRKERGNRIHDDNEFQSEIDLLHSLKTYMSERKDVQLKIFLHPWEKENEEVHMRAVKYYTDFFENKRLCFSALNDNSFSEYYNYNIMISSLSTSVIERLFLGLKAFYYPSRMDNYCFHKTSLSKISIFSEAELFKEFDQAINQSNENFFTEKQLHDYINYGYSK